MSPVPFELLEPLGRGGMGSVWRARHPGSTEDLAIKVLHHPEPAAFLREVRATAALNHPGIVRVWDYGQIPSHARDLPAPLSPGAGWMLMELLEGGTLAQRAHRLDWAAARRVLVEVLEALASAHARGLVHRDLKPGNVIADADGRWRVCDLGIAAEVGAEEGPSVGTPIYASPEQLRGRRWEVDRRSDLWSVGIVAWELLEGRPPVEGSPREVLRAALAGLPAPDPSRLGAPAEVAQWVGSLLRADPAGRPPSAAHALATLPGGAGSGVRSVGVGRDVPSSATLLFDDVDDAPEPDAEPGAAPTPDWGPLPLTDRFPTPREPLPGPPGLGLGLASLRVPRLVGRTTERAALWADLRVAIADRVPTVHRLGGLAGSGRRTLAREIGARADECGGARALELRAAHLLDDALAALVPGPDGDRRLRAIASRTGCDPTTLAAWAELLGSGERHADRVAGLVGALLEAEAARVPLVVVLVGASDALESLLARELVGPMLILVVGDGRATADPVQLGPLSEDHALELLEGLLPLKRPVARSLIAQVGTLPGDLVHAIQRGAVEGVFRPEPDGFTVAPGFTWTEADAVDGWLAERTPAEVEVLAFAALLSDSLAEERLREAARIVGSDAVPGPEAVESGVRWGVLRDTPDGPVYTAPAAREAVEARLADRPRALRLAATTLEATAPDRAGELWLRRGEPARALPLLLDLPEQARHRGEWRHAAFLAGLAEQALRGVGRVAEGLRHASWAAWYLVEAGAHDEAMVLATRVYDEAIATDDRGLRGGAAHTIGAVLAARGDPRHLEIWRDALADYRATGEHDFAHWLEIGLRAERPDAEGLAWLDRQDPMDRARSNHLLLRIALLVSQGRVEEARALVATWDEHPLHARGIIWSMIAIGELDRAEDLADRSLAVLGDPRGWTGNPLRLARECARVLAGRGDEGLLSLLYRRFVRHGHPYAWFAGLALGASAAARADGAAYDHAIGSLRSVRFHGVSAYAETAMLQLARAAVRGWEEAGDADRAATAREVLGVLEQLRARRNDPDGTPRVPEA